MAAAASLWVAEMSTENFTFTAAGNTEHGARSALLRGFRAHLKQYGSSIAQWRLGTGERDPLEWYAAHAYELRPGDCLRDGSPLG
jgi:hypothetical protein